MCALTSWIARLATTMPTTEIDKPTTPLSQFRKPGPEGRMTSSLGGPKQRSNFWRLGRTTHVSAAMVAGGGLCTTLDMAESIISTLPGEAGAGLWLQAEMESFGESWR